MKLKLQFWKTNKAVSVTVLEQEGLPKNKEGEIIFIYPVNKVYITTNNGLVIGTNPDVIGDISGILTNHPRKIIDRIVKAITDELFSSISEEIKEGDTVVISGNTTYTVAKIFPEWYSPKYVLTVPEINKVYLADTVYPVQPKCRFTKDITDTIETYTWEI